MPGLRWYDRTRTTVRLPGNSRSYVGPEMRLVDRDIDPNAPTIFELARPSFGALSVITRGLKRRDRNGQKIFEMFSETVEINKGLRDELFTIPANLKVIPKKGK